MKRKIGVGTAAVLSFVGLAACEDRNTAQSDTNDRVVVVEPAMPPGVTDDRNTNISASVTNAPAELNGDTREYVRTAAMGDMFEVEASRVALMRARSAEVKKFAQDMIDAHTKTSDDLRARLARAGLIVELPTMLDADHQKKLDDLKAASAQAFEGRYISQQKDAHDEALMLHRNYAMRGTVADLKAFAADLVPPKIAMHVKMASELQSGDRTG